jgi:hypothetical protein
MAAICYYLKTITLNPDVRLGKRTMYTVRVEGAGDTDGLAVKDLGATSWSGTS